MTSAPDIELGEPETEDEWSEYYRLRYERLRKPLGQPPGSERDDPAEPSSIHVMAKVDGRVVGACCWVVGVHAGSDPGARRMFVRLRQIAVHPDFEGRGVGGAITQHVEERSRALGAIEVVANARAEKVGFFRRQGWIEQGDGVTMFGTVEHVSMVKRLR
jgi:GNAT superfamily N-acetyltransferase